VYSYHFDKFNASKPAATGMDFMLLRAPLSNVLVHSKDFIMAESGMVMGKSTHIYRNCRFRTWDSDQQFCRMETLYRRASTSLHPATK
jgi:hypothetical protein